jgi:Fur family peroxide stress response transcriptional regulator
MYSEEKMLRTIVEALRRRGYRATPQRIAICKFALQASTHPTAQEIYKKVREIYPTISLATVYQTLKVLKELNLIQELPFFRQKTRFDPYTKPHINLVCSKCGKIKDLDDPIAKLLVERISRMNNFKVNGQRIEIYGLCGECVKNMGPHVDLKTLNLKKGGSKQK